MIKIDNLKPQDILKKFSNPRLVSRGFFRLKRFSIVLAVLSGIFFLSCNKELDTIGIDLIDTKLRLSVDTILPVSAFTQIEDSVPTTVTASLGNNSLLGFINDPVFGKTKASIYTEILPPTLPFSIAGTNDPNTLSVDSVVLSLAYGGSFGDITSEMLVRVYELDDTIPAGTVYSNRQVAHKPFVLHESTFVPLPNDTVFFYGEKDTTFLPAHLRLNLDHSLARKFIDNPNLTLGFTSYDPYRLEFFSGLHITAEETSGTGAMLYFNLRSPLSRLQIFYKIGADTITQVFEMSIRDQFARKYTRFENFDHQFASSDILDQAVNGDTLAGMERIFVQSMSNFRSRILLPDPQTFINDSKGDIAINTARLIIPVDADFLQDTLPVANRLVLLRGGEEDGEFFSLQDQAGGALYFGGALNKEKMEYVFNITQHLQMVMMGVLPNYPLYLRVSGSMENAERAVLKGPLRENGMRLEIRYTEPVQ